MDTSCLFFWRISCFLIISFFFASTLTRWALRRLAANSFCFLNFFSAMAFAFAFVSLAFLTFFSDNFKSSIRRAIFMAFSCFFFLRASAPFEFFMAFSCRFFCSASRRFARSLRFVALSFCFFSSNLADPSVLRFIFAMNFFILSFRALSRAFRFAILSRCLLCLAAFSFANFSIIFWARSYHAPLCWRGFLVGFFFFLPLTAAALAFFSAAFFFAFSHFAFFSAIPIVAFYILLSRRFSKFSDRFLLFLRGNFFLSEEHHLFLSSLCPSHVPIGQANLVSPLSETAQLGQAPPQSHDLREPIQTERTRQTRYRRKSQPR